MSAPVATPDVLTGSVVFTDVDPRNKPTDKRNFWDEEVYADKLEYSFAGIERLIAAYDACKRVLVEGNREAASIKGLDQSDFSVEVASEVLTLFVHVACWHWGATNRYGKKNWLTGSISESDDIVALLKEKISLIRALPCPDKILGDLDDLEAEGAHREEQRLLRRKETLESIGYMEDYLRRNPSGASRENACEGD